LINSKTVLVLSPHSDDAELGCGGTIARLVESFSAVYSVVFTKTEERQQESFEAAKTLGITQYFMNMPIRNLGVHRQTILDELISLRETINPDLVIQPSMTDIHQDHQVIAQEGLRAFKNTTLWGFEAPWNHLNFDAQLFVKIEERHLMSKIKAVGCYKSQRDKRYISEDYIRSLAKVRGVQIGFEYAEMFSVIRQVIK